MKRYIALIFVILPCFFFSQTARADAANDLTRDVAAVCENISGSKSFIFDGDISTRITLTGDSVISLKCGTPVSQLYLVWDKPPNMWDLTAKDLSATYGKYGFIHEYIALDEPQSELTLKFHGSENILCDLYAFAEGDVPDWVEQWQPAHDNADMLLLPAHAGDEAYYLGGGKLQLYAASLGKKLQLVYMTNQWLEPKRMHELISGLYADGIRAYPVISDFPDTISPFFDDIVDVYDEDAFIAFNVEQIRRFKPQVVLGSGEFNDGIRRLCCETLLVAAELSGDELEYRESALGYGAFETSKLYLLSSSEEQTSADWRNFELVRTTVGFDTADVDFFENIEPDAAPEPDAPPQTSAAEAPPAAADATPAAPIRFGPVKSISDIPFSLLIMGGVSVLCLVAAALLRIRKEL